MSGKFSKTLVSATAIVASTMLAFTGIASAAPNTTQTSDSSVTISMVQLDQHVATLPAVAGLKAGSLVTIYDDGTVTGATWSGTYAYYPAFSSAPFAAGYAHWKDGLVTLTTTPPAIAGEAAPGTLDANFVQYNATQFGSNAYYQQIATLVPDPTTNPTVWRMPNGAWLFRQTGKGQYTTLVDLFVFVSGGQPVYSWTTAGDTTQPIPVSAGYWSPQ